MHRIDVTTTNYFSPLPYAFVKETSLVVPHVVPAKEASPLLQSKRSPYFHVQNYLSPNLPAPRTSHLVSLLVSAACFSLAFPTSGPFHLAMLKWSKKLSYRPLKKIKTTNDLGRYGMNDKCENKNIICPGPPKNQACSTKTRRTLIYSCQKNLHTLRSCIQKTISSRREELSAPLSVQRGAT